MTQFRLDVHQETGEVMLWIETACGGRPVIGWPSIDGLRDFAEMLLDIYRQREQGKERIRGVSENILKQALGDGLEL